MNKRQEVAAWIFGLLLAFILGGSEEGAVVTGALPASILATLTIFSLRTRTTSEETATRTLGATAAMILLVAAGAGAQSRMNVAIREAQEAAEQAQDDADNAKERLDEIEEIPLVQAQIR